ncbi:hypothetical protein LQ948_00275 [Jiella sp. MQZ9-1]|uniref:HTH luxR-type domain-containing protein n=1 Tax=Jiella flava TaxID=2816857 RepID=A0A939JQL2_9HYPH|nr:hypothetical protein [Jiella flava]MBO0660993.1 hypothetical protein [Jiella flava]MCD2469641.1 hypothetical protein [Jiella flava]
MGGLLQPDRHPPCHRAQQRGKCSKPDFARAKSRPQRFDRAGSAHRLRGGIFARGQVEFLSGRHDDRETLTRHDLSLRRLFATGARPRLAITASVRTRLRLTLRAPPCDGLLGGRRFHYSVSTRLQLTPSDQRVVSLSFQIDRGSVRQGEAFFETPLTEGFPHCFQRRQTHRRRYYSMRKLPLHQSGQSSRSLCGSAMSDTGTRLTSALDGIYGALENDGDLQEIVRHGAEATRAERFNMIVLGKDGRVRSFTHPFAPEAAHEYVTDYLSRDIRLPRLLTRPSGFVRTQDLMSPEEIAICPVHQEFYRRHPECWTMGLVFGRSTDGMITLSAHRGQNRPDGGEEERRALIVVANHMARIATLKAMLPSNAIARNGALAAFDALDEAIVVFDVSGIIVHINPAARRMITPRDGLHMLGKRLVGSQAETTTQIRHAIAQTVGFICGRALILPAPVLVPRRSAPMPLILRFYASPAGDGHTQYGVIKLVDPLAHRLPDIALIRSATGLSNGEAMLAIAIYRGLTVKAFAEETGLSEQTVRKRLKHVGEKLGVSRQPEIATRIAALAAI